MISIEFNLDHPTLADAFAAAPETRIDWERSDVVEDDRLCLLVWVTGGSVDRFERGLDADESVASHERLAENANRSLYRIELSAAGTRESVYPVLVDEGVLVDQLTISADGWEFQTTFPDWESFERFRDFCRARDFDIDVHRLSSDSAAKAADGAGSALTERQHELLVAVLDTGYLEIPRDSSVAELGEHLNVSANSASQLFRRAVKSLIEQSVRGSRRGS
ncbi:MULTISPECIES: helix-turn-helix domain-containing protein [Halorussus]|uniref:helix-turn-helix domain-containing protein n=1 Tax=Halorussus TaxID=1070314 RepID=UPI0020A230F0|nr:helix-turn-helix domain-containing protein [Halorussus vallis]USZ76176.1 helix-turn-helix domain-containing protein [Halorussus vallis]